MCKYVFWCVLCNLKIAYMWGWKGRRPPAAPAICGYPLLMGRHSTHSSRRSDTIPDDRPWFPTKSLLEEAYYFKVFLSNATCPNLQGASDTCHPQNGLRAPGFFARHCRICSIVRAQCQSMSQAVWIRQVVLHVDCHLALKWQTQDFLPFDSRPNTHQVSTVPKVYGMQTSYNLCPRCPKAANRSQCCGRRKHAQNWFEQRLPKKPLASNCLQALWSCGPGFIQIVVCLVCAYVPDVCWRDLRLLTCGLDLFMYALIVFIYLCTHIYINMFPCLCMCISTYIYVSALRYV